MAAKIQNGCQNSKWLSILKMAVKIQNGCQNSKWLLKFNMAASSTDYLKRITES